MISSFGAVSHTESKVLSDVAMNTVEETGALLSKIPGGEAFVAFLGADEDFGDAEIVGIRLERERGSELTLDLPWKSCRVVFSFDEWVDVQLLSFSRQNVIGALHLRRAPEREAGFAEIGVGYIPAEIEFAFDPCVGAHGTVSGRVTGIRVEPYEN